MGQQGACEALGRAAWGPGIHWWPGVEREMDIARSACSLMDGAEARRSREKGTSQPTGGSSQGDGVAKDRSRAD